VDGVRLVCWLVGWLIDCATVGAVNTNVIDCNKQCNVLSCTTCIDLNPVAQAP